MLRLRCCVLTQLLSYPPPSPASHLGRLISAVAPTISPNPASFAIEDYLLETCGLARPQALEASAKLSHLKSPANPDSILAFLACLGLSGADVTSVVAKDPPFLCAGVEGTLAPIVAGLAGLGLSRSEIAHLVTLSHDRFRSVSIVSNLQYYLRFFGSFQNLLPTLRCGLCLLSANLEIVVKPNVAFLRECGLGDSDIAKLCVAQPWLLASNLERVREVVALAEGIGVPRGCKMFRHTLHAVGRLSEEKIAAKVGYLKRTFRWSDAEVGIVVSKFPFVLISSDQMLQSKSEFLISEAGLGPAYIAHRRALLLYNLEGRIKPRYYVLKFLKENGLLDHDRDYYNAVMLAEKVFVEKFICPHKEAALHLTKDYDGACKGGNAG